MRSILLMAALLATSGCTFVHMAPGATKEFTVSFTSAGAPIAMRSPHSSCTSRARLSGSDDPLSTPPPGAHHRSDLPPGKALTKSSRS